MPKIRGDVLVRSVSSEALLLDLQSDHCFRANGSAGHILDRLRNGSTLQSITESLVREYDISPEICEQRVLDFLHRLEELDLLEREPLK